MTTETQTVNLNLTPGELATLIMAIQDAVNKADSDVCEDESNARAKKRLARFTALEEKLASLTA